ncbi:MAG: Gfo/Idh/MocA family oxidoreductase [Ignavibacteria bacterium]|nr:Gfo/Idh/MocA family oxidoreductase [Ignavibacteria bacterium]MBT8382827.1 Gfo/Idh/MocA family oxidoreductase [Ignavibacteria bacterium]MBT8392229.1 Gfo/Idh/MocA family oxidoreductase [Ignavibacteria bacterium]NNJ53476.1 Gfo/Idh/MocA family oxidoreductase [Ignavibacteriaceae bacterium]NNL21724.1 Gfo/Idh/MocA family oxidoreductase [Ignavibacteriaceae bacterium]
MEKLKIGVIGTGHLGKLHTKLFKTINNCELVGIYDSNTAQVKLVSEEFAVPVTDSVENLLENVNAVSIAATTSAHFEIAKKCFEHNIHVFIEKPITASIKEAKELVELAEKKKLTLQVGHIERFNPALVSMEKYIDNPMFIQTDRLAQFNPRGTDVAVVLDLMIHDIDIILSLVNSDVANVQANGVAVVSNHLDIANARLQFENGAVANVTASRISQKKMRKMRIFQRDSYVALDFVTGIAEAYRLLPTEAEVDPKLFSFGEIGVGDKKKKLVYEQPAQKELNALQYELQLFVYSVLNNTKPVVSGVDGLRALKVAEIILEKIQKSQKGI